MKALFIDRGQLLYRDDIPPPDLKPGWAIVCVLVAGICSTDLELIRGYRSFHGIPGHEFVGVVEKADCAPELVGKRVVGEISASCGTCERCCSNLHNHCTKRQTLGIAGLDGAFAQKLALPVKNLHEVPHQLPNEIAVFAEPLAAACRILQQVHIRPSDRVAVFGDGRLGLLAAQVIRLTGCELMVAGHNQSKLRLLDDMGIRTCLIGSDDAAMANEIGDAWADVVVEATGSKEGFAAARRAVRPGGTLVLKSTYLGSVEADFSSLVVDEVRIVGSRCGPFEPALRLLEGGLVRVDRMISARYPLADGCSAFLHAGRKGTIKVLLDMPVTESCLDGETARRKDLMMEERNTACDMIKPGRYGGKR
jgi:threonine dehydrogenase-like Zn-dependent dehydrogenase